MKKRIIIVLLCLAMLFCLMAGCGNKQKTQTLDPAVAESLAQQTATIPYGKYTLYSLNGEQIPSMFTEDAYIIFDNDGTGRMDTGDLITGFAGEHVFLWEQSGNLSVDNGLVLTWYYNENNMLCLAVETYTIGLLKDDSYDMEQEHQKDEMVYVRPEDRVNEVVGEDEVIAYVDETSGTISLETPTNKNQLSGIYYASELNDGFKVPIEVAMEADVYIDIRKDGTLTLHLTQSAMDQTNNGEPFEMQYDGQYMTEGALVYKYYVSEDGNEIAVDFSTDTNSSQIMKFTKYNPTFTVSD